MKDLKLAFIQDEIIWENIDANLTHFESLIDSIKEPMDLVVLPEMFSTGFSMQSKKLAETMHGKAVAWMLKMAKAKEATITGSLIINENGKYYNRLVWARPDGILSHYDKRHLFRMSDEQKHFSAGNKKLIVEIKGWKICPLICYDLRFPVWARNSEKYDLLLYVANWPSPRKEVWKTLLKARAIENISYTVGVNRVGTDGNNYHFAGNSMAINPRGEIISELGDEEKGIRIVSFSRSELLNFREKFPAHLDADNYSISI